MNAIATREKIFEEIQLIPEAKLAEVYNFIHCFRLGLEQPKNTNESIMQFAGSWKDMQDDIFDKFNEEIASRRKQAFSERPNRETNFD